MLRLELSNLKQERGVLASKTEASLLKIESLEAQVQNLESALLSNPGPTGGKEAWKEEHRLVTEDNRALRARIGDLESRLRDLPEIESKLKLELQGHSATRGLLEEARQLMVEEAAVTAGSEERVNELKEQVSHLTAQS